MRHLKRWCVIACGLFVIDFALGVAITNGYLPLWTFTAVNFPFGAVHAWFESLWIGTRYELSGRPVNELWSFITFFSMVFLQAWLYYGVFLLLRKKLNGGDSASV